MDRKVVVNCLANDDDVNDKMFAFSKSRYISLPNLPSNWRICVGPTPEKLPIAVVERRSKLSMS